MTLTNETETLLNVASAAAAEALAEDPVAFDVTATLPFNDAFLVLTADNPRHLRAVKTAIEDEVHERLGLSARLEGGEESEWLLLDYQDVAVHIFLREAREYYALDRLWSHAPRVDLSDVATTR